MKTLLLLLLVPSVALAQRASRPHRGGLWGELGLGGAGRVRVACSRCSDVVSAGGNTSYFRIGGTVSNNVLIGGEIFGLLNRGFGFVPEDSTTTAETVVIAATVIWFPTRTGWFLKGGVGAAVGEFSVPTGSQADTSTGGGIGLTFGMGWDWSISRKFAITANVGSFVTAVGDVVLPGRRVDDVIATLYAASLGFTFR